ncbi:MAG: type II secretion system F family protein [Oceanococcaceae bacterium]
MAAAGAKTSKGTKLKRFNYQGVNKSGSKITGIIEAPTDAQARLTLTKQGLAAVKVQPRIELFGTGEKKITTQDIAVFSRQLATMMKAGVPLVSALAIVSKGHENPSMGKLLDTIRGDIESGSSLAEALSHHPKYFDGLFVNLVSAGEKSGALESLLHRIATYKEKSEALRKKVKKALTYPIAVLVIAVIVTAILLIFVVPQFQDLFQGFGADLPAFTLFVIKLSAFMQAYIMYIIAAVVAIGFAYAQAHKRSYAFRKFVDRLALKLPVVGDIQNKSAVARFSRTLATMFAAGVPLVDALDSVAKAAGNIVYEEAIMTMREQVMTGVQLQVTMEQVGLWPPMATQMIAIGEESGALDDMSEKVAEFYEGEVDNLVDNLSALMEPMIMAVLGVLVGGLVVAMYLPIFKLGAVVG